MKYDFQDVDLWIELSREYVRSTGSIPPTVWNLFQMMCNEDLKLSIYGHHRILKYPKLKAAFIELQLSLIPEVEDADGGSADLPGLQPSLIQPTIDNIMFH